ncbi:MAG TPA: hypothetical protein VMZ51_07600 [Acidimicrobiales bacterium]|nr:hypothetical protein [Acidimicrobiales bacterium]
MAGRLEGSGTTTGAAGQATVGSCYGFGVTSSVPLQFVRSGSGVPLQIAEERLDDPPGSTRVALFTGHPERPFRAELRQVGGELRLQVNEEGWFGIDTGSGVVTMPPDPDEVHREERLWSYPASLCLRARRDLAVHAAAVEVAGQALVFVAPGGTGKTTLAAAFHQAGYRVLAEDISCCRVTSTPVLFPGPALLRMRPDSAERMDLTGTTVVARDQWRSHLSIDGHRRGTGDPVPIGGVILLKNSEKRDRLTPLEASVAIRNLYAMSFKLPLKEDQAWCFSEVVGLVGAVPGWQLERRRSYETLPLLVEQIVATCCPASVPGASSA